MSARKRPTKAARKSSARRALSARVKRTKVHAAKAAPRRSARAMPSASRDSARTAASAPPIAPPQATMLAPNGRPVTSGIGVTHHHMGYTSHDLEGMKRFFTETLGFTNILQVPERNYVVVYTTPTSSVGFTPPMSSAPEQWRPPGEPALYLFVADVDRAFAQLHARGVIFEQAPTDMPWGHRLAILKDPEGRIVCLAQNLTR